MQTAFDKQKKLLDERKTALAKQKLELEKERSQDKSKHTYTFGFAIDTKIETVNLGGKYKTIPRFPLGAESTISLQP